VTVGMNEFEWLAHVAKRAQGKIPFLNAKDPPLRTHSGLKPLIGGPWSLPCCPPKPAYFEQSTVPSVSFVRKRIQMSGILNELCIPTRVPEEINLLFSQTWHEMRIPCHNSPARWRRTTSGPPALNASINFQAWHPIRFRLV
jgi:hypothetical protein